MRRTYIVVIALFFCAHSICGQHKELSERLQKHVEILASDSLQGRGLGTGGKLKAAHYIESHFKENGLLPVNGSYTHDFEHMYGLIRANCTNIVGQIQGQHPQLKNEYIVIGAHYDHLGWRDKEAGIKIYNGADDNASGTATIIELSRLLAHKKMDRSIILIAFDAEESGLWGSSAFLKDSVINPAQIKMMFSIDMVGMYKSYEGVDFKGMDLLVGGTNLINKVNKGAVTIKKTGVQGEKYTDTKPFLDRQIPAAHVFTGLKSPYHKPEDTAEKLDYEGMALICELMNNVAEELGNDEVLEANNELKKEPETDPVFSFGYKVGSGIAHVNYKGTEVRSKNSFAFETGIQTQVKLSKLFFLSTDFLYGYNKVKLNDEHVGLHSFTIPVQLKIKTPDQGDGYPRFYASSGMFFNQYFSKKFGGNQIVLVDENVNNDNGVCFGLGFELNKFMLDCNWRIATSKVVDSAELSLLKNSCMFSLGYKF